tara:strand:- start:432 stop:2183 length:1752 start_codon:yes stop_codon:yes gene_type:complete
MTQRILNVGQNANDGTGDTLRDAMIKVNNNFTDLYASPLFNDGISISGNEIKANRTNDDLIFEPSGTGGILFPAIRINDNNIEGTRSNEDINLIPNGTGSVVFGAISFSGNNITATRSNDDIVFEPAGTGGVVFPALRINGNNIEATRTNDNINLVPSGTGTVTLGSIGIAGTTLSSADSSTININEGLIVDGTLNVSGATTVTGTVTAATGSTFGNITIADGSITDSSGAISFGNENLSTTGTMTAGSGSTIGNLTLANGSITDSGGSISFGDENISTTGTANFGATTVTALTVSGAVSLAGTVNIDNLNFNDNIISSDSNADIRIEPGGSGSVIISNLTIDSNINITDNVIKATASNSDLIISPSGSGKVVMSTADIDGGNIDNTVIGGTTPLAGTFTTLSATTSAVIDGVTISDNSISTNASNSNLELSGNGSGSVTISGFTFPTSDGSSGQFLKTDGAGTLAFATAGATLSVSAIADATTTVSSSSTSVLNTFSATSFRSAKYFISITDSSNSRFEIVEANVTHDGTDAYIAVFGSTTDYTGPLTTFSADINSGNVRVLVTNITNDSLVFKFQRMVINV